MAPCHKKTYQLSSDEGQKKYQAFLANKEYILETNQKKLGFNLGFGPWADLTNEEYKAKVLMKNCQQAFITRHSQPTIKKREKKQPLHLKLDPDEMILFGRSLEDNNYKPVDWTSLFSAVRDQGNCSSSWAFSFIDMIDVTNEMPTKDLKLSPQQLIDCDSSQYACDGGDPMKTFEYIKKFGIMAEKDYEYLGAAG